MYQQRFYVLRDENLCRSKFRSKALDLCVIKMHIGEFLYRDERLGTSDV